MIDMLLLYLYVWLDLCDLTLEGISGSWELEESVMDSIDLLVTFHSFCSTDRCYVNLLVRATLTLLSATSSRTEDLSPFVSSLS